MPAQKPFPCSLSNYDLVSEIGAGNSGTVYSVRQSNNKCQSSSSSSASSNLACKIIPSDKLSAITRREILIASKLSHPNIVPTYHVLPATSTCTTETGLGLIMEHASQGDLFKQVISAGSLTSTYLRKRILEICSALTYLHKECQIVHLDIKLENIVITNSSVAKLIDFGCAKFLNSKRNTNLSLGGTLHYLAPEIIQNPYDCPLSTSMDAWSLGVLIYTALTGNYPFCSLTNDNTEKQEEQLIKQRILNCNPNPFPDYLHIPHDLSQIISGLLEKDPAKRMTIPKVIEILQSRQQSSALASSRLRRRIPLRYQQSTYRNNSTDNNNRTRTPSPASTADADFATSEESQQKCVCHLCKKQSINQISSVIDFALSLHNCHNQKNSNKEVKNKLIIDDNSDSPNYYAKNNGKQNMPRVDSIISTCSMVSHETASSYNSLSSSF